MTFAEKLGVRDNALGAQRPVLEAIARAHRHRRSHQYDGALSGESADLGRSRFDLLEVRTPVVLHRRSDRNDDDVGGGKIAFGREADVDSAEQLAETRLAQRICSTAPRVEPSRIALDARHAVPQVRKDRGRDRADIPRADNGYAHHESPRGCAAGTFADTVARRTGRKNGNSTTRRWSKTRRPLSAHNAARSSAVR